MKNNTTITKRNKISNSEIQHHLLTSYVQSYKNKNRNIFW